MERGCLFSWPKALSAETLFQALGCQNHPPVAREVRELANPGPSMTSLVASHPRLSPAQLAVWVLQILLQVTDHERHHIKVTLMGWGCVGQWSRAGRLKSQKSELEC